ncbi:hypothetical protein TL16_g03798 [Triparma laevis f. inornata]|uniref:FPL domain-containing protein n=1 Tax=Triparma laevis f. inornata TaxID=1714386 RepID=A0A9W7E603_9STRA|nr:hypothetical protein TL16_g03798 [Triparma laevis f. inornata]
MLTELRQTYSTIIDNLTLLRSHPTPSPALTTPYRLKMKQNDESTFVESLRRITELVLYGDLHDPEGPSDPDPENQLISQGIFEYFAEKNTLTLLVDLLTGRAISESLLILPPIGVSLQILQTVTILMQNVRREVHLYYLLSNGYVEELMVMGGEGVEEEFFVRELEDSTGSSTVQFKLCTRVLNFLLHPDSYVRLTSYNILLNLLKTNVPVEDKYLIDKYIEEDENVIKIINPVITNLVKISSRIREKIIDNYENTEEKTLCSGHVEKEVGELQDEIILLDDILGIERISRFVVEIVLGGYIYPVLLEPLLICVRHEGRRETKELGKSGFLDELDPEDADSEAKTKWRRLCPARTSLICLTLFFNNITSKPLLRLLTSALFHPSSPSSKLTEPDSDEEVLSPVEKPPKNEEDGKYILAPNLKNILDGDLTSTKPNPYRRVILSSLRRGSSHAVSLQSAASGCVEGCVVRIKEMEGLREVCGLGVRGKKMNEMFLEEGGGSLFEEVDVRGERSFSGVSDNLGEIDEEISPPPATSSPTNSPPNDLTETITSLTSSLITTPYTTCDGIKLMSYNFGTANGLCLVCKGRWGEGVSCVEGYRRRVWAYFEGALEGNEDIWESFAGLNPKQVFAKDSTTNSTDRMTPNIKSATNEECMREAAHILLRVSALINWLKRGDANTGEIAGVVFSSGMEAVLGMREVGEEEEEISSDRIMELEGMTACPCVVKIEGEVGEDVELEEEAGVVSEDGSRWQSLFLVIYEEEGGDVRILFAERYVGGKGKVVCSCRDLKFLRLLEGGGEGEEGEEGEVKPRKFKMNLEWVGEAGRRPKLFGEGEMSGLDVYFETETAFNMCVEDVRGRIEKAYNSAGEAIRNVISVPLEL